MYVGLAAAPVQVGHAVLGQTPPVGPWPSVDSWRTSRSIRRSDAPDEAREALHRSMGVSTVIPHQVHAMVGCFRCGVTHRARAVVLGENTRRDSQPSRLKYSCADYGKLPNVEREACGARGRRISLQDRNSATSPRLPVIMSLPSTWSFWPNG